MPLDTKEQAAQYLILAAKSDVELRAICEGLQLETFGTKDDLLDRLCDVKAPMKFDITKPQMIPLRTRDERGNEMPEAAKHLLYWRKLIFENPRTRDFKTLNAHGKEMILNMRYLTCPTNVLQIIMQKKWFDPRFSSYRDLVDQVAIHPEQFTAHIVQHLSHGKRWIMLHVEARQTSCAA